jgi:hypothetical protein
MRDDELNAICLRKSVLVMRHFSTHSKAGRELIRMLTAFWSGKKREIMAALAAKRRESGFPAEVPIKHW